MDTRMLDVAIGLALVFAMLSLVATAIQEAHTAMRNKRGRNLARQVCSLVGDNRKLSEDILSHPFLVSMAMEKSDSTQRTPSYLSSDVFVTGLIAFLTGRYTNNVRPPTPQQLVSQLKHKMDGKDQQFAISLDALLGGAELDWPTFELRLQAWFDAVGERASGWYKRENQVHLFVIGVLLAVAININPVVIASALWQDAALRKSTVADAELALRLYQKQDAAPIATTDAPVARPSYMSPALEKYLALIQALVEGLPAPAAAEFQNNLAHEFVEATKQVDKLRTWLVQERTPTGTAEQQIKARNTAAIAIDAQLLRLHAVAQLDLASADACRTSRQVLQSLCAVFASLKKNVADAQLALDGERLARRAASGEAAALAMLAAKCGATGEEAVNLCAQSRALAAAEPAGLPIGWSDGTWPKVFNDCVKGKPCPADDTAKPGTLNRVGNFAIAVGGWMLTAIGVTLGAPFWFDLLGRMVKLRNSGAKPADSEAAAAKPSSTIAVPTAVVPVTAKTPSDDALNDDERRLTAEEITRVQRALPMEAARHSGRLDLLTRETIAAWQGRQGAPVTGQLTAQQIQLLLQLPTMQGDDYVG
jgi:hypothetical protein